MGANGVVDVGVVDGAIEEDDMSREGNEGGTGGGGVASQYPKKRANVLCKQVGLWAVVRMVVVLLMLLLLLRINRIAKYCFGCGRKGPPPLFPPLLRYERVCASESKGQGRARINQ